MSEGGGGGEKLSFRQKAARKLEEATKGANRMIAEAEESAAFATAKASQSYEAYQLKGKYANEDKYAKAWRGMCMAELEEPSVAQARLHDYASAGDLENTNPMVQMARKIAMENGTDAAARLAEQDELVATMDASAQTLAEQQVQALQLIETASSLLMPAEDKEHGGVAADVAKILEACGSVGPAAWADGVTKSIGLSEEGSSALFAGAVVGEEFQNEEKKKVIAYSQMKDALAKTLKAEDDDELADAQTAAAVQERELTACQAKHTAMLLDMRTQAYTTSLDQLTQFVDAQASFFAAGLAAMEALKPQVDALKAKSEQATASTAGMTEKLSTLATAADDAEQDAPTLKPAPTSRTLRAGTSVLGKALGAPQYQGYLWRDGNRRWCVLINGKLYEYAESWEEAPVGSINMFLCNAKPSDDECSGIELLSMNPEAMKTGVPPVPTVYQATSEEEQQAWLNVIVACTEFMITHPPSGGGDDEAVQEDPQVTAVRSVPGNDVCADCAREMPEWVSISLGTTMCSECSGAHRGLGTHINSASKVQSLALDKLDDVTMELLQAYGNTFANSLWESDLPDGVKPGPSSARTVLAAYVGAKYKDRKYANKSLPVAEHDMALIQAAKSGDVRGVGKCLVGGCNINFTDPDSEKTALMIAVEGGSLPAVELIVNNGADLLAADKSGATVMHQVVSTRDAPALSLLVKRGAWISLDTEDSDGKTPRALAEGEENEAFVDAMTKAAEAVEAKKAQESRMAAGKVYYDATKQLAEGKITDAIAAFESGLEMDPDHSEMEAELIKAREMQTSLGDEAPEEAVASFEKKYKLKMQLSGGLASAKASATQAAESARVAAQDAADTAKVTVDHAQRLAISASDEFDPDAELHRAGSLEKRGARARDGFKKRWFELRGHYLAYYEKAGGKLKGDIPLVGALEVQDSTAADAKAFEIEIKMEDRVYRLNCPDADDRKEWIAALLVVRDAAVVAADTKAAEKEKEEEETAENPLDGKGEEKAADAAAGEAEPEPEADGEADAEAKAAAAAAAMMGGDEPEPEPEPAKAAAAAEEGVPPEREEVAVGTENADDEVAI